MSSINKVILVGNLGRDPEIRHFPGNKKLCTLSIATSITHTSLDGTLETNTEWHRVSTFYKRFVGVAEQHLRKGSKVYIEGQLRTTRYIDRNGVIQYSTQVNVSYFNGTIIPLTKTSTEDIVKGRSQLEAHQYSNGIINRPAPESEKLSSGVVTNELDRSFDYDDSFIVRDI